ncbi:MAG: preprotein translocase subunit YajC [Chitinophagales bacterium]|nr:preprotein translocase subunit YajC [Chitinophagales bacterium]
MNPILLQAGASSIDFSIIFYVMIVFLIINFVILVPKQKKKEKAQLDFIDELQKGSKVVTLGGLHGTVVQNEDKTFIVEIATGVKVKVEKTSISYELTKKLNEVPAA